MKTLDGEVIAVVGMGRSGTSTITRGLAAIGVGLGPNLMGGDPQVNPLGFWEDNDLHVLCQEILKQLKMPADSLSTISDDEWTSPEMLMLKSRAIKLVRQRILNSSGHIWGCKNPRMALLMSFWLDTFSQANCNDKYVLAIRHPLSVADSIKRLWQGDARKTYALWMAHNMGAIKPILMGKISVVVDYDLLMSDPKNQLERMAARLELPFNTDRNALIQHYTNDFLKSQHRHSSHVLADLALDKELPRSIAGAYELLYQAACDRISPTDTRFAAQWNSFIQQLGDAWNLLSYFEVAEQASRDARRRKGIWPFGHRKKSAPPAD